MTFVREATTVSRSDGHEWKLLLTFKLDPGINWYHAAVQFDRNIIPEPIEVSRHGDAVDREKRRISFPLTAMTLSSQHVKKTIKFRFSEPGRIPHSLSFLIRIRSYFRKRVLLAETVIGTYLSGTSRDLLAVRRDSAFYFPSERRFLEVPLSEYGPLSPLLAKVAGVPWALTWPEELPYWISKEGTEYLALQLSRMTVSSALNSEIRLALCPYLLGTAEPLRADFLRELEVQSRCGISIKMITPRVIEQTSGDSSTAVDGLGDLVGFRTLDTNSAMSSAQVAVHFEAEVIQRLRSEYAELDAQAMPWRDYKSITRTSFAKEGEMAIVVRSNRIRRLAAHFASSALLESTEESPESPSFFVYEDDIATEQTPVQQQEKLNVSDSKPDDDASADVGSARVAEVFISYAREDESSAEAVDQYLRDLGISVWLDRRCIIPGQDWKNAITKAVTESRIFLALTSSNSVDKRGYVQKEIRLALEALDEIPPESIYLIPVRLDDCHPKHRRLAELQWVDLFPDVDSGLERIVEAMRFAGVSMDESKVEPLLHGASEATARA